MIETTLQGAVKIVSCNQPLLGEVIEDLEVALEKAFSGGRPMAVFDMENVPLLDSSALEKLLELSERFADQGGSLKIATPNPLCSDAFRITGVGQQLEIYTRISDAVGSFVR